MENMEIKFNVKDYYHEQLESSAKALGLVNALMRVDMTEDEFVEKVKNKITDDIERKLNNIIRNTQEIHDDNTKITEINNILDQVDSKLKFRTYIFIDKDLCINHKIYLTENKYFYRIFNLSDICIPIADYWGWDIEKEYADTLDRKKLYIFDESDLIECDLHEDVDDKVEYTDNYYATLIQVLQNNKVETRHDCVEYIDIYSEDKRIYAEYNMNDISDLFLMSVGQARTERWDKTYQITISELDSIVRQIKQ